MHARLESSASDEVSVRSLAGLGSSFLPTVGHPCAVAFASCLFLTSYPFGILTLKETPELNTGD